MLRREELRSVFWNSVFYIIFMLQLKKKKINAVIKAIKDYLILMIYSFFPRMNNGKLVVIGMAPLDKYVFLINKLLKGQDYIYHTSWLYWDGSDYPKKTYKKS
ncbi:hypothetical protein CRG93_16160 [Escherichia sp. E2593]|nr:hypothetical protein CRG93_16160 [Escherichia sp. E2593]